MQVWPAIPDGAPPLRARVSRPHCVLDLRHRSEQHLAEAMRHRGRPSEARVFPYRGAIPLDHASGHAACPIRIAMADRHAARLRQALAPVARALGRDPENPNAQEQEDARLMKAPRHRLNPFPGHSRDFVASKYEATLMHPLIIRRGAPRAMRARRIDIPAITTNTHPALPRDTSRGGNTISGCDGLVSSSDKHTRS